jgi:hypothetical protein
LEDFIFTHKDEYGDSVTVSYKAVDGKSFIRSQSGLGVDYTKEDAPKIAGAILEAVGIKGVFVDVELMEVTPSKFDENSYRVGGESVVFTSIKNARYWVARDISLLRYMEEQEALKAIEDKEKLTKKREEWADKYTDGCHPFSELGYTLQKAINDLIKAHEEIESLKETKK